MENVDFNVFCNEALGFLQQFMDSVKLNLIVQAITEDEFEDLVFDQRSRLNWREYFPHYLEENSFHAGFKLTFDGEPEGAFLTVYSESDKHLHVLMLESLVRDEDDHPLKGRLTALTVVAITDLLSAIPDSVGAYIVQPHSDLTSHYKKFGFSLTNQSDVTMHASLTRLQQVQFSIVTGQKVHLV